MEANDGMEKKEDAVELTEQKPAANGGLDIDAIQAKLAGKSGKHYWQSLDEIADTKEFRKWMDDEFPNRSTLLTMNRRDLLKFMGASMALAGLAGCRGVFLPQDKVIPYVKQPEELVPGVPLYYASSIPLAGFGMGVLVEQHEGRPTKIEGNPLHPGSLGALDVFSQAEILGLYDPDRARSVINNGDVSTWELFNKNATKLLAGAKKIAVLTGAVTSPTMLAQLKAFKAAHPNTTWYSYEPHDRSNVINGLQASSGQPLEPIFDFTKANVVISLDSSFLSPEEQPGALKYARDFASKRRVVGLTGEMSRVYAFESTPTLVGIMADHRWAVKSSGIAGIAGAIAEALGIEMIRSAVPQNVNRAHFSAMMEDIRAAGSSAVVVAGPHQPAEVHAVVAAINAAIQSAAVQYISPVNAAYTAPGIGELKDALASGSVDVLLVVGGNPAFDAPGDVEFEKNAKLAKHVIYLGRDQNETAALAEWALPMTHPLEEWGDLRAFDGSVSIIQPLIAPLFEGRSAIEVLSSLSGKPIAGYDILKGYWQQAGMPGTGEFEARWRDFVHDGVIKNSAFVPKTVSNLKTPAELPLDDTTIEINFRPDPTIFDGRFANNGWLQELPAPVTKLTWDNAAIMSMSTAKKLGLTHEDVINLEVGDRSVKIGVFLQPGQADDSIVVNYGYGRTVGGAVATASTNGGVPDPTEGGGVNVFGLRTLSSLNSASGVKITKLNERAQLVTTQGHRPLQSDRIVDERDILREVTIQQFLRDPEEVVPEFAFPEEEIKKNNLYVEEVFEWNGPQWGMTIDLNTCIGCNACVTACQAENNIPVVGKQQVANGREMHWIRIDRYYKGDDVNPQVTWQPLMCVHCEKAPCEPVCPVAATVHSHEGLNQMIYNRCVGTRYCSNNCPYKVRRFNYLNYSDNQPNFMTKVRPIAAVLGNTTEERQNGIQLVKMLNNPDVTVRGRGIMEKCTYCVQRINDARKESKKAGRDLKDGEIITACEQACPTQSIVFGNIADKESRVSKLRNDPRAWLLLEELQTRPRTSHLAKLRNPNPEITPIPEPKPKKAKHGEEHGSEGHAEGEAHKEEAHKEESHSEGQTGTVKTKAAHGE